MQSRSGPTVVFRKAAARALREAQAKLLMKQEAGDPDARIDCPDPVVFFREWLGIDPWPRQEEILRAVAAHSRVAVRSGHKVSKSNSAAGLSLWWAKTQPDARVVLTAPTSRQVEEVLWREIKMLYNRAAQRGRPIGGRVYSMPDRGISYPDGRQVFGFSTSEADRFSGLSGNILWIPDEASGVSDAIFEAIEGNRAGGGDIFGGEGTADASGNKLVLFGNPTRTAGKFYRAFRDPKERELWHRIHISSEEAADYQAEIGRKVGYLATKGWVNEKKKAWGEQSPLYFVRVKGEFAPRSETALISLQSVERALERWQALVAILQRFAPASPDGGLVELTASEGSLGLYLAYEHARTDLLFGWQTLTEDEQKICESLRRPLTLGIDVAQFGADASVIAPRRGDFCYPLLVIQSMDGPMLAGKTLEVVRSLRRAVQQSEHDTYVPGYMDPPKPERPKAKFDRIGNGASAYDAAHHNHNDEMEVVGVSVAEKALDEVSDKLRDQVWAAARDWLEEGGMLPPDDFLQAELLAPDYQITARGKVKVDDKDHIKAKLPEGRSPDRADALCLAVYEAQTFQVGSSPMPMSHWG